jgi:hypothetical protein
MSPLRLLTLPVSVSPRGSSVAETSATFAGACLGWAAGSGEQPASSASAAAAISLIRA